MTEETLDSRSTKEKLLDATEAAYALQGIAGLSARKITASANTNLASVNYYFGSVEGVLNAVFARLAEPIYTQKAEIIARLQVRLGDAIRPIHIFSALLLPMLRDTFEVKWHHHKTSILFSQEPLPDTVRGFLSTKYSATYRKFDDALLRSCPALSASEALWRSRLFINASPGSILNPNTKHMLAELLRRPNITFANVLVEFGVLVGNVLGGPINRDEATPVVDALLLELRDLGFHTDVKPRLLTDPSPMIGVAAAPN